MKIKLKPLADFVFLTRDKEKSEKEGIIFSDVSRNRNEVGEIEAVGPDCPQELVAGTRVAFNPFVARKVKIGGIDYLVIRAKEIYCIL